MSKVWPHFGKKKDRAITYIKIKEIEIFGLDPPYTLKDWWRSRGRVGYDITVYDNFWGFDTLISDLTLKHAIQYITNRLPLGDLKTDSSRQIDTYFYRVDYYSNCRCLFSLIQLTFSQKLNKNYLHFSLALLASSKEHGSYQ